MGTGNVSKGYTLFQRKGGKQWYMRFSIRGQGQQRLSLGTDDEAIARRLAEAEWYKTCALADAGLSIAKKSFADIAEDFISSIEKDVERGEKASYHGVQYPRIIRRYFVEFFGSKQMSAIKAADIQDYWDWRREYWVTGPGSAFPYIVYERFSNGRMRRIKRPVKETYPSDSTMAKELLLLNRLFQYGKRFGYVLEIPQIELVKSKTQKSKSRPGFTLQEFLHLTKVSEKRVEEYSPYKDCAETDEDKINQRHFWDRAKLHAFCMVAAFTGMRPTELFNLSWGDLEEREVQTDDGLTFPTFVIQARGKGKERELAAMPETLVYFHQLRESFLFETKRLPKDDDPVFVNRQGKRIRSFKIGLAQLLEAAELRRHRDGRLRDSFSFRHFYITQQIREGVGHHILSRNTGTSTKMIDAYYSKIRPTEEIKQLIPDWLKRRPLRMQK